VSELTLTARQIRYTNKAFWRNPAAAFFTFVFPLMFLVIFATLLGSGTVTLESGREFNQSTYYVASMAVFSVITACYTNLAIGVTFQRDAGILKRTRGTPLPGSVYLGARVIHVMMMSILLVGSASFAALGLALPPAIPHADAAPPIVNATILPLLFISGIFFPVGPDAPQWIETLSDIFPVRHLVDAFLGSFYGPPLFAFSWRDVGIVAAWGLAGLIVATRYFSWEPRR
jgi:ABC-2 type transport system permease protein